VQQHRVLSGGQQKGDRSTSTLAEQSKLGYAGLTTGITCWPLQPAHAVAALLAVCVGGYGGDKCLTQCGGVGANAVSVASLFSRELLPMLGLG
jgi:hypothetical protein